MSQEEVLAKSSKRRFSEEFKQNAVRLVTVERYSLKAAAASLGINEQSLRAWCKKYAPPAPCGEQSTVEELRAEITRLRKRAELAELEREILKKATAYFAKESR